MRRTTGKASSKRFYVETLESRQLMAADLQFENYPDAPLLRSPDADVPKIYTALRLEEINAGGKGGTKPSGSASVYVLGNRADALVDPSDPSSPPIQPVASGLALVGGGTDVDEVFRWMGAKANGGDFVVLRATGTDAYNPYIDAVVPALDSVTTLVVSSRDLANNSDIAQLVRDAEAIFIAGGDQANYINFWTNTALESAIYQAIARGAPIGGTSAGLAVLSEFDFTAQNGTIISSDALANPNDSRIVLSDEFLSEPDYPLAESNPSVLRYLDNLVTDSHFQQRDRFGRLVAFVARIDQLATSAPVARGLGMNEQTALLIEDNGLARVVGNPYSISKKNPLSNQLRNVYLLAATETTTGPLGPGQPLTYTNVSVVRADYDPTTDLGDTFDFNTWTGVGNSHYTISSNAGVMSSTQPSGSVY